MRLGHGQTNSVLILWTWTALLSGLVLYPSYVKGTLSYVTIGIVALAVALYTAFGVRSRTAVRADSRPADAALARARRNGEPP